LAFSSFSQNIFNLKANLFITPSVTNSVGVLTVVGRVVVVDDELDVAHVNAAGN
jgi:hypothetical protein